MRIKCQYKGKVLLSKNDEIIIEENLPFETSYEPKDYILSYLENHKIDNLENFKIDFEFEPLNNEEWTFTDIKEGNFYIMPKFSNYPNKNGNIEKAKDFYIVENLLGEIYVNPYKASYIFNKFKQIGFLIFYNYNYKSNSYDEVLVLSMPSDRILSEEELDKKIIQFCNLLSSSNNNI